MSKINIRGALPALITPFDERGEVDVPKLKDFVKWLAPQVNGMYVCGSYGSGPIMTTKQRNLVGEVVQKEIGDQVPIILHIGDPSTNKTIDLAKHAMEIGVAAIASLTPYYYLHGENLITLHFKKLIDTVDTPVFLYNNPKYTNYCVNPGQMAELAAYGLAGFKDSSTSIQLFYNVIAAINNPEFCYLMGSQTMLYPGLGAGGDGCVSGLSNLFPGLVNDIFDAAEEGNNKKAVALQHEANELRSLTGAGIPVPFYHVALKALGIDIGQPRLPLVPANDEHVKAIQATMKKYSHLK